MEPTRVRDELFGEDDFLTFEEVFDFEIELDIVFFEEELFEDPLLAVVALLLLPERILVILPRVELVLLGFVAVDVFGMFLSSGISVFFGLEIFTLREVPDSETFVEIVLDEFCVKAVLSIGVFRRIVLLLACLTVG